MPTYTWKPTLSYISRSVGRNLIAGTLAHKLLNSIQLKVITRILSSVKNIVVNSQEHVLY